MMARRVRVLQIIQEMDQGRLVAGHVSEVVTLPPLVFLPLSEESQASLRGALLADPAWTFDVSVGEWRKDAAKS